MANQCCNPFGITGHYWSSRGKNLRTVTQWMCERAPHISLGSKICDTCRKKVSKLIPPEAPASKCDTSRVDEVGYPVFSETDSDYIPQDEAISSVNKCLLEIGATPISKKRTHGKNYSKLKLQRITEAMQKVVLTDEIADDGREMIEQLKEKYSVTTERDIRLQILTVLPKSWSVAKVQKEFGVSTYTAQKTKKIVQEKGVLSLPDLKAGPSLLPGTVSLVCAHYESDEVSRVMPGKKDFVFIRRDGKRVHIQKRLVLSNLKEIYQDFKVKFPSLKIGFSKFAQLRPKHCVLAGASGTHCVCVCTVHQNVKLMMLELHLTDMPSYKHGLAKIMCNPPLPHCYFGECDACPKTEKLQEYLITSLEENDRDQITYKQWVSTDRSTLETHCAPLEEFVCTTSDYEIEKQLLERRFVLSCTIPGTRKLHSIVPISRMTVRVKPYSSSKDSKEERVTLSKNSIQPDKITGFVTCLREGKWWLACVLEVREDNDSVKLTCLHPHGPSASFEHPHCEDICILPLKFNNILTLVDPRTRTGRTYTLTKKEIEAATEIYHTHVD